MLNLMYITKRPEIACIAEEAGVDWIFVDMEFIGKGCRQGGLDTVQNHHTVEDVVNIKTAVKKAKVLVRINPIHEKLADYPSSEEEIEAVVNAGADIIMLPFFKKVAEVQRFLNVVDGRAKTCLLVETPEAALLIDEILELKGIDMVHLGLNDLHLALGMKFMFELLADGTVDRLSSRIKAKGIPFGFGGIATLTGGAMPGCMVLKEHYRLGSSMVIVSRSFCNTDIITDLDEIRKIFNEGIAAIRQLEEEAQKTATYFSNNRSAVLDNVRQIVEKI
jgi:2-keto-3-deoxy-L-rhamnonate aldolase RhmA